ncbi:SIR2 family NAD-dependent protein deacylase [Pararhodospirillum photometricum]|uniref:Uncharacterized protein n=1 Tax=Pararhodospirillum photometricum DSM 122 TaxID=1150469 RepID=H6SN60_PARPM|nr:SIR2 family protein [Pararhodospirillum photometricum]CCG06936.1 Putative uncharacterized protein [Pararhodospirillum photometricum DSM 122]
MTLPPAADLGAHAAFWAQAIRAGRAIPYLGPGVLAPLIPTTPVALAAALNAKVPVPGRIRANLWSSAQFIETRRHRVTLDRALAQIFAPELPLSPLAQWLAGLPAVPLLVDAWYETSLSRALAAAGRTDWGQVQGANRQAVGAEDFFASVSADGTRVPDAQAQTWATVLYKPYGSMWPLGNVLVSDSDYVEALTEIDIQTPIPPVVQERRCGRGFLFLGCRFDDQMSRTYARQIMKRSAGPHAAVLADPLTRNEERFLEEQEIVRLEGETEGFVGQLIGADTPTA